MNQRRLADALCVSYTATQLLLHRSHSNIENKRREKDNSNVLSPFHATLSLQLQFYLAVQHGASVNLSNAKGNTALHEAVIGGNEALVELLLQNGAVTHLRNERNRTPADCAEPVRAESSRFS